MAGQPMKRMMIAELERRAKLEGETLIQYVHDWIAAGQTLRSLVHDLGTSLQRNLSVGVLTSWLHSTPEGKAMLANARLQAAASLAEEALELLDDADESKEAIAKAKAQADQRNWLAARWNRKEYGVDQAATQVNINLPAMHLDALRARAIQVANTTPQLPPVDADYEIVSDVPAPSIEELL